MVLVYFFPSNNFSTFSTKDYGWRVGGLNLCTHEVDLAVTILVPSIRVNVDV